MGLTWQFVLSASPRLGLEYYTDTHVCRELSKELVTSAVTYVIPAMVSHKAIVSLARGSIVCNMTQGATENT